jgi:hypothetical protein
LDVHSTAHHSDTESQTFRVTHPFHPLFGCTIPLVEVRQNWSDTLIFFRGALERLMSIPAAWTTFCEADPFITLTEGRSAFRCEDLLALRRYLDTLGKEAGDAQ